MGLRYSKRIGGNKGLGLNVSGSGISPSYRTKYGAVSPKGFSIRTGIPGLSFRSGFGRSKSGNAALVMLILGVAIAAVVVAWNLLLFAKWVIVEVYHLTARMYYKYKMNQEEKINTNTLNNP
ncbi:DUF4236 domain-containing protein [Rufibacter roseus]|uniref:DUF4236 domain-containing protein n=1 Tax=Rufibacter roseus TaxID=1567108 RepID=A0ABW2DMM9_9BACT|nr:DUF4236 domain-containing protein [Rufibacter roseus]